MSGLHAQRAYVALGSNLGEREATLEAALRELEEMPGTELVLRSRWIETAPVGGPPGQGAYLNGVAVLLTELEPLELLRRLLAIEARHGRDRAQESERNAPRTLDLDLLEVGTRRVEEPELSLPHPRMERRRFVLEPLAEIEPEHVLPSGTTVRARLAELERHTSGAVS